MTRAMSAAGIIYDYIRYNHWANTKMVEWLRTLEVSLLYQPVPSSFNSIDLTMQHMVHAQNFWFSVITETLDKRPAETIKINEAPAIMKELLEGSLRFFEQFGSFTEEALLKPVHAENMVQSRYKFIMHAINHNSYHRGQIITISRNLGVVDNIPNTDYDEMLWEEY